MEVDIVDLAAECRLLWVRDPDSLISAAVVWKVLGVGSVAMVEMHSVEANLVLESSVNSTLVRVRLVKATLVWVNSLEPKLLPVGSVVAISAQITSPKFAWAWALVEGMAYYLQQVSQHARGCTPATDTCEPSHCDTTSKEEGCCDSKMRTGHPDCSMNQADKMTATPIKLCQYKWTI